MALYSLASRSERARTERRDGERVEKKKIMPWCLVLFSLLALLFYLLRRQHDHRLRDERKKRRGRRREGEEKRRGGGEGERTITKSSFLS